MDLFDFAIASDYPYDDDFIHIIEDIALNRGLRTYVVLPHNLEETLDLIKTEQIKFLVYYDRASDTSEKFLILYNLLVEKNILIFQDLDKQIFASDKSEMHHLFEQLHIKLPRTIIIPEFIKQPSLDIAESELKLLGNPFVIKPASNTGASLGGDLNANSWQDVEEKRKEFPGDKYLIQERIIPKELDGHRFWFRVFFILGKVLVTWWDNFSHRYNMICDDEISRYQLHNIDSVMKKIYGVCHLNFFSTEFVINEQEQFIAIDYINEICDMRVQSKHYDGVPDEIVRVISERIIDYVYNHTQL